MSKYSDLDRLNKLKEQGAITAEEFEREKKNILDSQYVPTTNNSLGMDEKTYCLLMHLSQFVAFFIAPLIMWLVSRDKNEMVDRHGKAVMNWTISAVIYYVASIFLSFIGIGILLIIALVICGLIFTIIGAVKASNGEDYKYPLAIQFIK